MSDQGQGQPPSPLRGTPPREGRIERGNDKNWWQPALLSFTRMSAWVAGPVLLGAFMGSWMDEQQGTEPWFFLGSVGVAFLISITGLVMEAGKEIKKAGGVKEKDHLSDNILKKK